MTLFTQDESKNLVESVTNIMADRVAGVSLPKMVREAAIEAGKAAVGRSLEERSQIMHQYFNSSSIDAQAADPTFLPTNATVSGFNEVATNALAHYEAAQAAGSFEDVADDPGSPLSAEDVARLNKRKNEEAESAGSFEDVAKSKGSPLQSDQVSKLNKRKTNEDHESAGSFSDVADDEGSPLSAEDRARLNKRKVKEELRAAAAGFLENIDNFGDKKKKFPDDKDGDGKVDEAKGKFPDFLKKKNGKDEDEVNEEDTSGTDKPIEDAEQDERRVSVKTKTVRDIENVPVSQTHSFVKESWTLLVNAEGLSMGEQHLLAGKLVEEDDITEASASCPTNRQPFTATVSGGTEIQAIENFVSALENIGSQLDAESVLVAHRTPSTG